MLSLSLALPGGASASIDRQMMGAINGLRQANGVPPLRPSRSLCRSSGRYSNWMMGHNYFGHLGRIRASRRFSPIGEVLSIHAGSNNNVSQTVNAWAASAPHRAVLLSSSFTRIGTGRTVGPFRGDTMTIWVVHLGAR